MSLTDKVIKNTFYFVLSQLITIIFPLFLTPFIISKIGQAEFGIYALVLGFAGTFGIFDLSLSSSFIKFISEYYNKKEYDNLNSVINTGLFFYIIFSLFFSITGFLLTDKLLSLINMPVDLYPKAFYAFRISIIIFFISSSFAIFNSILISLQKMYLSSIYSTLLSTLNFAAIILLLNGGYGLIGLMYAQLAFVSLTTLITCIISKRELPIMRISSLYFKKHILKKMTGFGVQMHVSKLATFASEKYDEFLLGFFSILSNVTFYNISGRIVRVGKFLPYQLIPQVPPVAAELNAKGEDKKLQNLFSDTTKYLSIISIPIFTYIFIFSDVLIISWMGKGYELSSNILRILAVGQLINMVFSAPGNSITPNIGIPKYQMYEGLIHLAINLVLSYILIKYYGIIGAAYGNSIAAIISSLYVFYVSVRFFNTKLTGFLSTKYFKPFISSIISGLCSFIFLYFFQVSNRVTGIISTLVTGIIFLASYALIILNFDYLENRDKIVLFKMISKVIPVKMITHKKPGSSDENKFYMNEKVSVFIMTCNRYEFLKKCLDSLLPTLELINYELIIWDNNSEDGTKEYLKKFENKPGFKIILSNENIGQRARAQLVEMCTGEFIIGIEDDVLYFPDQWVQKMIHAYKTIPHMGYLSADVVQDETTTGAKLSDEFYEELSYENGKIKLQIGPLGAWCFMISQKVHKEIGKFQSPKKRIFYGDDADYAKRILGRGLKAGVLKDLKVFHATGEFHNKKFRSTFENKNMDYRKGDPLYFKIKRKVLKTFNIKRYWRKLEELAEAEMKEE